MNFVFKYFKNKKWPINLSQSKFIVALLSICLFVNSIAHAKSDTLSTDTTAVEKIPNWEKSIAWGSNFSHTLNVNAPPGTPKQGLGFNNAIDIFANYVKETSRFNMQNELHWTLTLSKADGRSRTVATSDLVQTLHDLSYSIKRNGVWRVNTIFKTESPLLSQFDGSFLKDYNQLGLIQAFFNPYRFNISPGIKYEPRKGIMISISPYSIEYYGLKDQFIADKGAFITDQRPDGHYVNQQVNKLGAEANIWFDKKIGKRVDIKYRFNISSNYQDTFLKNGRMGGTFITKFFIFKGLAITHRATLKGDLSKVPLKPFYNQVTMLSYTLSL
jgi:hypothetical protein